LHRTVARQNQRLLILFQLRNLGTHDNDPARFQKGFGHPKPPTVQQVSCKATLSGLFSPPRLRVSDEFQHVSTVDTRAALMSRSVQDEV